MFPTGKYNACGNPITKPACVISYNKGMGRVDHLDQISATCHSEESIQNDTKRKFFF